MRGRRTGWRRSPTELLGLLHQRGEALGGRVAATGRGAAAEFADFLMLQAINRYEPLLAHYADSGALHPEELYQRLRVGGRRAGDVHDDVANGRRSFPAYRHDRLRESFEPVIVALRESLSKVLTQSAISIPIEPKKFGISVAIVADRALYSTAVFILAARADVPSEELRRRFPGAARRSVRSRRFAIWCGCSCRACRCTPVPVAPRQIPYHAGFAYFELDQTDELWEQLKTSGGVAHARRRRVPGPGDGVLGDSRADSRLTHGR